MALEVVSDHVDLFVKHGPKSSASYIANQFLGILHGKAEKAGRRVVPVNARNTSRTCPPRRHVAKGNRVSQADFTCQRCGHTVNADVVGAVNVLSRAGLVRSDAA